MTTERPPALEAWTASAAALAGLLLVVHLFAGELDVHRPLRAGAGDGELGLYVSVLWHAVSVSLAVLTAGLSWAARDDAVRRPIAALCAAQSLGVGLLFVGYGLWLTDGVWVAPQWLAFGGVALLAVQGARRGPP